jgi:hypothetical protein
LFAVRRFERDASPDDWVSLMGDVSRHPDSGGACLKRIVGWALSQDSRAAEIDGKPNYNMGPVKFATVAAMFWGIAGFTVGLIIALCSSPSRRSISICPGFRSAACGRCIPRR